MTLETQSDAAVTLLPSGRTRSPRSKRRRLLFIGVYAGFLGVLFLVAYRVCLWVLLSVPPTQVTTTIDPYRHFYRELFDRQIVGSPVDGETVRVLLLGGSVAEQVGDQLQVDLAARLDRPVRVFNAGMSAHTTRDSLNKLEYLAETNTEFDLILIYHGINDVSLNRIPTESYRDDYTHFGWYLRFDAVRNRTRSSLNLAIEEAGSRLITKPLDEQLDWGHEIKTPPAFEANLRRMVAIAHEMHTPIVLMTFAIYLPQNYTTEAYYAGELDYGGDIAGHSCETWGWADNVRKTVAAHNERVRRVANDCPDCLFVDMEAILNNGPDFTDICHLTESGTRKFTDRVVTTILDRQDDWQPARRPQNQREPRN